MSNLFDESSLAMIPTAYKDGKLYSVRPTPEYGAEEVTNGDFATDSDWNKNSNWTISGGVAIADGSSDLDMNQGTTIATIGKSYKITYEVVNISQGGFFFKFGGVNGVPKYSVGVYTEIIQAVNTNRIALDSENNAIGSIDNVSVKEVLVNGDFTFSRGTNLSATRVNASQLIEKGRENVLLQSNQFDTTWVANGTSVTSGQTGYDGSSDAWLLEVTATGSYRRVHQSGINLDVNTFSIYAKANTSNFLFLLNNKSSTDAVAFFDLSNGSIGGVNAAIDTKIESVGNGWYRCSVTSIFADNQYYVLVADGISDVTGTAGASLYIQDAQIEQGLVATPYIETGASTAQAGILENTPRLDYSGGASCPSLLLEPSRTNLVINSEYFGAWTPVTTSVISNNALSPDGLINASKLLAEATSSNHQIDSQYYPIVSGSVVGSVYAKKGNIDFIRLRFDNTSSNLRGWFDLENGVVGSVDGGGEGKIESVGNGWYRCTLIESGNTSAGSSRLQLFLNESDAQTSWTANGDEYIHIWGAQTENPVSYPTSYIPTYGVSQTRAGDACYLQDTDVHSSDSGTIFFEVGDYKTNTSANGFNKILVFDEVATTNLDNAIYFEEYAGNNTFLLRKGGSTLLQSTPNYQDLRGSKIAIKWSSQEAKMFIDGVLNNTYTGDASLDIQYFGFDNPYNGNIVSTIKMKQLLGFPTALSDVECIALTTI